MPSRITSDLSSVSSSIGDCIQLITTTYTLASMLTVIAGMSLKLTLILILDIPYVLLTTFIIGRLSYKVSDRKQSAYSRFMNYVTERLGNLRLIKSTVAEDLEIVQDSAAAQANYRADVYGARVSAFSQRERPDAERLCPGRVEQKRQHGIEVSGASRYGCYTIIIGGNKRWDTIIRSFQ